MLKIDAQVHIWKSDRPSRPWDPEYRARYRDRPSFLQHAGQTNTVEMALEEMQEAGVEGAVLATLGVYGPQDNTEELAAVARWPERFRLTGIVAPGSANLSVELEALRRGGLIGIRLPELRSSEAIRAGAFDPVLAACNDLGLAVMLPSVNAALPELLPRFPHVTFFLNHLGLGSAPPIVGYREAHPFAPLREVLELSDLPNLALKLTGVPAHSTEAFPFRDIWAPIRQVLAAFGPQRLTWGGDFTRTNGLHSYWEAAHYLEEMPGLGQEELELLYAGALLSLVDWPGRA
ncbi:amidohydrolase family protein [Allosediminivita pacifica]|uniref:Putative TIM-barrel fold metal-dependent hydrolase n=1 Tax=Allosediminivita pacifica TaxID=1267769 RepID=A0A2T6A8Y5_9RHOB|nr:amidohydrolase family protein [Allosediminivita pacifica]PTX40287.1 putative TIM-barrel fold metal-dependent hydrolase [Allosediminivita pacifica]GGB26548.1 hypothetical protein GCM10011324_40430 [Allosediminivita pacifica]